LFTCRIRLIYKQKIWNIHILKLLVAKNISKSGAENTDYTLIILLGWWLYGLYFWLYGLYFGKCWLDYTWLYLACFFPSDYTDYMCFDYTDYTFGHGIFWLFRIICDYIFLQWLYGLYLMIHMIRIITYNQYNQDSHFHKNIIRIITKKYSPYV